MPWPRNAQLAVPSALCLGRGAYSKPRQRTNKHKSHSILRSHSTLPPSSFPRSQQRCGRVRSNLGACGTASGELPRDEEPDEEEGDDTDDAEDEDDAGFAGGPVLALRELVQLLVAWDESLVEGGHCETGWRD